MDRKWPNNTDFFCGFKTKPQAKCCAKLDDWISRCVGPDQAAVLAGIGVNTVETLADNKDLMNAMIRIGHYFDPETQSILSIDGNFTDIVDA